MGLLSKMVSPKGRGDAPNDNGVLIQILLTMGKIDGNLGSSEQTIIEALAKTVPQLRGKALSLASLPRVSRKELIDTLTKLTSEPLRRQCYALAVEVALASGDVNESEDQFTDLVQRALRIDDAFARGVIEVIAAKYAQSVQ